MSTRWQQTPAPRGEDYDARWVRLAAAGERVHGEADLIDDLLTESGGRRVLDAGCGTGRVAIELARRGYQAVGVDADDRMLTSAVAKAPEIDWRHGDLTELTAVLGEGPDASFDAVVLAGNVMIFLDPGTEERVLAQVADRLTPGGVLVAGFSIKSDRPSLADYDRWAAAAGCEPHRRWATWDRKPYVGGDYAVSVHRRMSDAPVGHDRTQPPPTR